MHDDWARALSVPEQLAAGPQTFVGYEQVPSALPAQVPPQVGSVPQDVRVLPPCGFPDWTGLHVPTKPARSHAMHEAPQAVSQQTPSGEQVVPPTQPAATVWQVCPCLLLHVPVPSQVPAQRPFGSS